MAREHPRSRQYDSPRPSRFQGIALSDGNDRRLKVTHDETAPLHLKTAKALGVTISRDMLLIADEVIE
jgi:hypothetical protein